MNTEKKSQKLTGIQFDIQMTISKLSTIIDNANTVITPFIRPTDHSVPSQTIPLTSELNTHATEDVYQHSSTAVSDTQTRSASRPSAMPGSFSNIYSRPLLDLRRLKLTMQYTVRLKANIDNPAFDCVFTI